MSKALLIYKASAGSGKTFTLVKEYLRLAMSKDDANYFRKILAITFTNKAAQEMKERVINTLKELSLEKSSVMSEKLTDELGINKIELSRRAEEVYKSMVYGYNDIGICTIDSFVIKLLKSFTKELNIPAGFEVNLDLDEVLDLAIEQLIQSSLEKESIKKALLATINYRLNQDKYWDFRDDLKNQSKVLFDESSQKHLATLQSLNDKDFSQVWDAIEKQKKESRSQFEAVIKELLSDMQEKGIDLSAFKGGSKNPFIKLERFASHPKSALKLTQPNVLYLSTGDWFKKNDQDLMAQCAPFQDKWIAMIKLFLTQQRTFNTLSIIHECIFSVTLFNELNKIIGQIKNEEGSILISDNHTLINRVVQENPIPFVYERLGERYNHLMIDEFQDTSLIQFQNAVPIIEENLSKNYFNLIVGDTKQSIYRFRGGEFEQLALLPENIYRSDTLLDGAERERFFKSKGKEIFLEQNFRSKKEIVDFNNFFFESLLARMDEHTDLKGAYSSFQQKPQENKTGGLVHLEKIEKEHYLERLGENLRTNIQDCLDDGYLLSDICILVRGKTQGEKIAKILSLEPSYPFVSSDSLKMSNSHDVQLIMSYLRHLSDWNSISAGLKIVQLFEKEALSISKATEEFAYKVDGSYYKEHFDIDAYLLTKGIDLTQIQDDLSIFEMTCTLISAFNIQLNDPFIQQLLDFAHDFGQKNGKNLSQFMDYWDERYQQKGLEAPEGKDAIKILTIHKSKGLEFPVVLLPFTEFKSAKSTQIWTEIEIDGLALKNFLIRSNDKLEESAFSAHYLEERNMEFIDNLNLLYVALTRPEDRLYIYFLEQRTKVRRIGKNRSPHSWFNTLFDLEEGQARIFGERTTLKRMKQEEIHTRMELKKKNWKSKLVYDQKKMDNFYHYEKVFAKKLEGILIHEVFEKSENIEQCLSYIDRMNTQLKIDDEQARELKDKFTQLFKKREISQLLSLSGKRLNEASIIDRKGKVFRPDKLIFHEDTLQIIDFKTGEINESHREQLDNYGQLMSEMGYENIRKHILYFSTEELISWN